MTDPLDAFRKQGEIDAAKPLPIPINWKVRAEKAEAEIERLKVVLVSAERKLVTMYNGMSPHGSYDGRRENRFADKDETVVDIRAALEAKP